MTNSCPTWDKDLHYEKRMSGLIPLGAARRDCYEVHGEFSKPALAAERVDVDRDGESIVACAGVWR